MAENLTMALSSQQVLSDQRVRRIPGSAMPLGFMPIYDSVAAIQLQEAQMKVNIVQTCAPTADKDEEDLEKFYYEVDRTMNIVQSRDVTIVMGNFDAKVVKGKREDFIGEFGIRNERGGRLALFCQENNLLVINTYFKLAARRLYTWKSKPFLKAHHRYSQPG
ncbi:hypothetical protein J437_LFUL011689 [Ladona fulva]|uniref:Uncharacterized protein n=1 Tax=Ladona fulva TaxID=123851 RepID=A0A8K0KFI2_LADFU|nr:hypothetical protein J437_LFUL011689 [Ladona fulva]